MIQILDQHTINKIAAGEVVERPASVVKELVENAIDAKASAITVEIEEGGTKLIRVTDNGLGIENEEIKTAFLRHATSKIKNIEDLEKIMSLGFRGEALASIASVSLVEVITKKREALTGVRYIIQGGEEGTFEEIGCPEGTTMIIRNLFYNTPARRKFLKSSGTEAGHVSDLMNKLALSHPHISFKFIVNRQVKLHTSGNNRLLDVIFNVFGKEVAKNVLPINYKGHGLSFEGYIGKPQISRSNRSYENYYINHRYIKSTIIQKALDEAYKTYLPLHKYPFCVLYITIDTSMVDVNVHPTKMEVRFKEQEMIYDQLVQEVRKVLKATELIPVVTMDKPKSDKPTFDKDLPEPFEKKAIENLKTAPPIAVKETGESSKEVTNERATSKDKEEPMVYQKPRETYQQTEQQQIDIPLLSEKAVPFYQIIGQLFNTYWIVELKEKFYLIDQHAAHERVLYEKIMAGIKSDKTISQPLLQPEIVSLTLKEQEVVEQHKSVFECLGFEIEPFGTDAYAIRSVPYILNKIMKREYFIEILDVLADENFGSKEDVLLEKVASMACKAAVKGNSQLSFLESKKLIEQLLKLENPYTCPHGRPTIIAMTKYELEKKFKRIQS